MAADPASLSFLLDSLHRLGELWPSRILAAFFCQDPLHVCIALCLVLATACWVLGMVTGNYSWVDRLWTLAPQLYATIFYAMAPKHHSRLLLMSLVAWVWGLRLSYNFFRKGGYNVKDEDYRWPVLRRIIYPLPMGTLLWQLFAFFFIAYYQNFLLLSLALPAYVVWAVELHNPSTAALTTLDILIAAAYLALVLGETLADQQQWNFHKRKSALRDLSNGSKQAVASSSPLIVQAQQDPDVKKGFLTSGLFRYSRHPNFFCEQSLWVVFYLFSASASGQWFNWSLVGPVLLVLLFQGSTAFTESLTSKKYPAYRDYQKTTSRLIPWFPASSSGAKTD